MDNMYSVCKCECKDLFVKCKRKVHFDCLHSSYIPKERGHVSTSKYAVSILSSCYFKFEYDSCSSIRQVIGTNQDVCSKSIHNIIDEMYDIICVKKS